MDQQIDQKKRTRSFLRQAWGIENDPVCPASDETVAVLPTLDQKVHANTTQLMTAGRARRQQYSR